MSLLPNKIHSSWDDFLTNDIVEELDRIEILIGDNFVPKKENILRFLEIDLNNVKCVWLGQDAYYTMYIDDKTNTERPVANGRSFQPDLLNDWNESFSQKSLQNIVRLIHKDYFNIDKYSEIKKYKDIKEDINKGKFPILPPKDWFNSLEKQGVLFLNTYLTTYGKGNVHRKIWRNFSEKLITFISSRYELHWFLWGKESISMNKYIINGTLHESNHPTFCSEKYDNDFLKSKCFKDTFHVINWLG